MKTEKEGKEEEEKKTQKEKCKDGEDNVEENEKRSRKMGGNRKKQEQRDYFLQILYIGVKLETFIWPGE